MYSKRLVILLCVTTIFYKEISSTDKIHDEDLIPHKYFDDIYRMVNGIPFDKTTRNFQVEESHVTYYLFTRENIEHYITLNPSNPVQLNTSKRIVFIVHGWTENRRKLWYNEIKNAFLRKDDVYVVQVDYEKPASQNYVDAVSAVPDVASIIAKFILKLNNDYNVSVSNIEIVAHSLGAHVGGFVGKEIVRKKDEKLKKIVALDTAGPLWFGVNRLLPTDAEIVESIHTNNILGFNGQHGTVDFYPNGAELLQPGCSESTENFVSALACSHHRSYWFYIESLNTGGFTATRCSSWMFYILGICGGNEKLAFANVTEADTGSYFLKTAAEKPYSLD